MQLPCCILVRFLLGSCYHGVQMVLFRRELRSSGWCARSQHSGASALLAVCYGDNGPRNRALTPRRKGAKTQRDGTATITQTQDNRRDAKSTARQSRNRKGRNPLAVRELGNSSQLANNFGYCSAEKRARQRTLELVTVQCQVFRPLDLLCLCVLRASAVYRGLLQLHGCGLVGLQGSFGCHCRVSPGGSSICLVSPP